MPTFDWTKNGEQVAVWLDHRTANPSHLRNEWAKRRCAPRLLDQSLAESSSPEVGRRSDADASSLRCSNFAAGNVNSVWPQSKQTRMS